MLAKITLGWYWIRSSLWFIPSLMVIGAMALARLCLYLDSSVIPGSLQALHGIYAGGPDHGPEIFVPQLSVTVGVALSLVSLGFLIYFIHHVSSSMQADDILDGIMGVMGKRDQVVPHGKSGRPWNKPEGAASFPAGRAAEILATGDGYLQSMDLDGLVKFASERKAVIDVYFRPGDFITRGDALMRYWPPPAVRQEDVKAFNKFFIQGAHRTPNQDLSFGINMVVEIAVRALSPSINDPFTTLMCVDRLGEVLIPLAEDPPGRRNPRRARSFGHNRPGLGVLDFHSGVPAINIQPIC